MAQGSIGKYQLLVIGGSAGSLDAILQLLPALQEVKGLAIVLVVHRRQGESVLSYLLGDKTTWPVKEAEEKESIMAGTIYIAPADYHLLIEQDKTFSLDYSEKVHYSRPSIDVTFESAADVYGSSLIALLLSGANQDGTEGLKKIKAAGGYIIVQDPAEAAVSYMPQQAINHVNVDDVLPVAKMPFAIQQLTK
jgi:two-component system chemotaxis response regulator CheB